MLINLSGDDVYFARQELERKRRLVEERQAKLLGDERERERALHFMRCPKCGTQLQEIAFGDVRVDQCFSCGGIWLDKGELELMQKKEAGFMERLLRVFD